MESVKPQMAVMISMDWPLALKLRLTYPPLPIKSFYSVSKREIFKEILKFLVTVGAGGKVAKCATQIISTPPSLKNNQTGNDCLGPRPRPRPRPRPSPGDIQRNLQMHFHALVQEQPDRHVLSWLRQNLGGQPRKTCVSAPI